MPSTPRSRVIRFPQRSVWRQVNQGELFGDLYGSFNLDLTSNKGKVRVSPQTVAFMTNADDSNMKYPVAYKRTSADGADKAWVLAGTKLYKLSWASFPGVMAPDAIANTPTVSHLTDDMDEFAGSLVVSNGTDLSKLTAGTWTANWWTGAGNLNQSALGANPHPTHTAFNNLFCFGDGNKLHTVDTSNNVDTGGSGGARLTLKTELQVVWIRSSRSSIWIGCRNTQGRAAEVIQWDGSSATFNNNYKLNSSECLSGLIKDDVPFVVIGSGEFQQFNGRGFVTIDNFPVYLNKGHTWADQYTIPQMVHRNGMAVIDGNIQMLVSSAVDSDYKKGLENFASGIWEWTKETGLYHKYSVNKVRSGTNKDFGSPVLVKPGFLAALAGSTSKFVAGAEAYANDGGTSTTEVGILFYADTDTLAKMGYLILPQVRTNEIEEVWQTLWILAKKFLNATSNVQIKYRLDLFSFDSQNGFDEGQSGGAWASTTSFTFDKSSYADITQIAIGDEVQITSGVGSGLCAQVTNVGTVGNTVTVTIDQTVTGATTQNITVRFSRWVYIGNWQDVVQRYKQQNVNQSSLFIQFKLVLFGLKTSPELDMIKIRSQAKKVT